MKILDEPRTLKPNDPAPPAGEAPEVSIFLPVYNEEPNLMPLHAKLDEALKTLDRAAEIVYVDDGSTDGSLKILREIAEVDPRVRVVALRRNYGQTAARAAGSPCRGSGAANTRSIWSDRRSAIDTLSRIQPGARMCDA